MASDQWRCSSSAAFAPSSFLFENLLIDGGGMGGIYWDNVSLYQPSAHRRFVAQQCSS
jgi:hypothetical protein